MNRLRFVLFGLAFLLLGSVASAAPGVAIRWSTCFGDGGTFNRNFACNTNTGINVATCSFQLASPVNDLVATVTTVDVITASLALPTWWQMITAGSCRQTALAANVIAPPAAVACLDWTLGAATTGISSYTVGTFGPASATIVTPTVISGASISPLAAGQEYFTVNVTVSNAKTVGTGSCAGCNVSACLAIRKIEFDRANVAGFPDLTLTAPTNGTDANYITWQGGAGAGPLPGGACSQAVPARNTTWGGIKALYR